MEADHTKRSDCEKVITATLERFGRLDILFNNAGIVTPGPPFSSLSTTTTTTTTSSSSPPSSSSS